MADHDRIGYVRTLVEEVEKRYDEGRGETAIPSLAIAVAELTDEVEELVAMLARRDDDPIPLEEEPTRRCLAERQVDYVTHRCELNAGHEGNHRVKMRRGSMEWSP